MTVFHLLLKKYNIYCFNIKKIILKQYNMIRSYRKELTTIGSTSPPG